MNDQSHVIPDYIGSFKYCMDLIPQNISIVTMTIRCKFGTIFKMDNIYRYMKLNENDIVSIKSIEGQRCYDQFYKNKKNFHNQLTIIINIGNNRYLNVKLFRNGSIQITGCKKITECNIAIDKMIVRFKEQLILCSNENIKSILFVNEPDKIKISDLIIDLINTNFAVCYQINKEKLLDVTKQEKIIGFIKQSHSGVNIKYELKNPPPQVKPNKSSKYIHIFIFQTGKIIITAAKRPEDIREAYIFIVTFLNKYKNQIIKLPITSIEQCLDALLKG